MEMKSASPTMLSLFLPEQMTSFLWNGSDLVLGGKGCVKTSNAYSGRVSTWGDVFPLNFHTFGPFTAKGYSSSRAPANAGAREDLCPLPRPPFTFLFMAWNL